MTGGTIKMVKKGIALLASVLYAGAAVLLVNPCVSYAQSVDNDGYDIVEERDTSECDDDGTSTAGAAGETGAGQDGQVGTETGTRPTAASSSGSVAAGSSETASSGAGSAAYAGQAGSYKTHVLDNTPKTADMRLDSRYAFTSGLFFAGVFLIISADKRNKK